MAQEARKCAQFISKYKDTRSFWKRLGKNVFSETSAKVASYNSTLDGLMQQFRDRAVVGMYSGIQ
ncbi:hypothetical protein ID866_7921, partial [Astraeus odoratus]